MGKINIGLSISAKKNDCSPYECNDCLFFKDGYYPNPSICLLFNKELSGEYACEQCVNIICKVKYNEETCPECGGTENKHYLS